MHFPAAQIPAAAPVRININAYRSIPENPRKNLSLRILVWKRSILFAVLDRKDGGGDHHAGAAEDGGGAAGGGEGDGRRVGDAAKGGVPDPGGDPVPSAAEEEVPRCGIRKEESAAQKRLLQPAGPRSPLCDGAEAGGGLRLKPVGER